LSSQQHTQTDEKPEIEYNPYAACIEPSNHGDHVNPFDLLIMFKKAKRLEMT